MKKDKYDRFRKVVDFILKVEIPFLDSYIRNKVYDSNFYKDANDLKTQSSYDIAKIIVSFFSFNSVFDIGCGCGLYIAEFHRLDKDVLGCDGSPDAIKLAPKDFTVFHCDVTKPLWLNRRFDLVLCIEVAEHINKKYSEQLIKNCTNYSNTVIFTAAPPGQGGVGHINEQPHDFWIQLFTQNGFYYDDNLSNTVRQTMKDNNVVEWIANNFMAFKKYSSNI